MSKNNDQNDKEAASKVVQFQFAQRPVTRPGWAGVMYFIWNSESSEFLGRTAASWGKIILFYIIYYGLLAVYFTALLFVFYQTLDPRVPRWQNANGIIGENPGLGFRPRPASSMIGGTLIHFRRGPNGNWKNWVKRLDQYLEPYTKLLSEQETSKDVNLVQCDHSTDIQPPQMCRVEAKKLLVKPCSNETNYGFDVGTPCVVLKLNKIFGWIPKPYNSSADLPAETTSDLDKLLVKNAETSNPNMKGRVVWITCAGSNPSDRENLGPVDYYPYPGIQINYYPYMNQEQFQNPIVFAHVKAPKFGIMISIVCKAWAKNIRHDVVDRIGLTQFELLID